MSSFNFFAERDVERFTRVIQRKGGLWLFHHIPKTAGTSMTKELRQCFPPYCNIHAERDEDQSNRQDSLGHAVKTFLENYPEYQFQSASGHLRLKHIRQIAEAIPNMRTFTFLRDPVARVISEYRYTRTPKHPGYKQNIERYPSIHEYIEEPVNQNKMWAFVAPRNQDVTKVSLRNVFNRYAFIGTLENFADDFAFLTGLIGCPKAPAARENATKPQKENVVEITEELISRIMEVNARDIAFYDSVQTILSDRRDEMNAFVNAKRKMYNMPAVADAPA